MKDRTSFKEDTPGYGLPVLMIQYKNRIARFFVTDIPERGIPCVSKKMINELRKRMAKPKKTDKLEHVYLLQKGKSVEITPYGKNYDEDDKVVVDEILGDYVADRSISDEDKELDEILRG